MLTCREGQTQPHAGVKGHPATGWATAAYVEVWHAGLFELVPQSARDDVHWDVVSDDPADVGQGRLDRAEERHVSDWNVHIHDSSP